MLNAAMYVCVYTLQIVKRELTLEEKKKFLKFFTGSDRWVGGCVEEGLGWMDGGRGPDGEVGCGSAVSLPSCHWG